MRAEEGDRGASPAQEDVEGLVCAQRLGQPVALVREGAREVHAPHVVGFGHQDSGLSEGHAVSSLAARAAPPHLVSNALKFGAGAPVDVTLEAGAERARLSVRDGGPGIPVEEQHRIFERFERAASTRHHAGLGLGLWIGRQVVHAHGGEVQVESVPGEGATFRVTLPWPGTAALTC